jgi:hypothetical protein
VLRLLAARNAAPVQDHLDRRLDRGGIGVDEEALAVGRRRIPKRVALHNSAKRLDLNSGVGVPAGFGAAPIGTAITLACCPVPVRKKSSCPSARQRGSTPLMLETCHLVSEPLDSPPNGRKYTCDVPDSLET